MNEFKTVATLSAICMLFMGCRFGNKVVSNSTNPDQVTGYYETQPQTLAFCSYTTTTHCKDVNPSMTPTLVSASLTNPLRLILGTDLTTRDAVLASINSNSDYLPVLALDDGTLVYSGQTSPQIAWADAACTRTLSLAEKGTWTKTNGPWTSGMDSKFPLSGRIALDVTVIISFDGNCGASMTALSKCYLSPSDCGESNAQLNQDTHDFVSSIFKPFDDANVLGVGAVDIPNVTKLAYEVSYQ